MQANEVKDGDVKRDVVFCGMQFAGVKDRNGENQIY